MNELYARAPHRRLTGDEGLHQNAALLIDFDNVTMGIRSNLGTELRRLLNSDMIRGKVAVQRAYADWRRYPQYIVSLSEASIDLIFAPAYGSSKKNATDIRLAIDALELVFTRPEIGTFILLSGDSDFSSLVLKLKEYGKYVIGVGMQESSSDLLVQNCDEYYSYNSISGLTSAAEGPTVKHDPWELASRTIKKMVERGDVMRSDRFKQVMLELDPGFDEKEIGFSKFNRFMTEAASRGIVVLERAPNGQYEVAPGPKVDAAADGSGGTTSTESSSGRGRSGDRGGRERRERDRSSEGRSRGRSDRRGDGGGRSGRREEKASESRAAEAASSPAVDEDRLRAAYRLLQEVVEELAADGEPVRDSEVKRRMLERDGKFDEAALGFRKFSRFLRQAHDEEVVNLLRGPEGNYQVAPLDGAGPSRDNRRERPGGRRGDGRKSGAGETSGRGAGKAAAADREREREEREPGPGEEEPEDESPADESPAEPADTKAREPASGTEEPAAEASRRETREPETAADEPGREHRRGGLGRFRRGGRSRGAPGAGEAKPVVPHPVEAGGDAQAGDDADVEASSSDDGEGDTGAATEPSEPSGERASRPSVTGRGLRRGSSRGAPQAGAPSAPAPSSAGASPGPGTEATASEEGHREAIEAMARSYAGVGRRTAEVLFSEFGDRVYDVIDSDPGKIREVLPQHRADAVISGREAERTAQSEPEA